MPMKGDGASSWRWRRVGLVFLIVVMLVGSGVAAWHYWLSWCARTEQDCWSREKLEAALDATLPLGSTRQEVEAWLEDHRIHGYDYVEHVTRADVERNDSVLRGWANNGSGSGREGAIRVFIFEPTKCQMIHGLASNGDLYVGFFFDKEGKLASHVVVVQKKYLRCRYRRFRS